MCACVFEFPYLNFFFFHGPSLSRVGGEFQNPSKQTKRDGQKGEFCRNSFFSVFYLPSSFLRMPSTKRRVRAPSTASDVTEEDAKIYQTMLEDFEKQCERDMAFVLRHCPMIYPRTTHVSIFQGRRRLLMFVPPTTPFWPLFIHRQCWRSQNCQSTSGR